MTGDEQFPEAGPVAEYRDPELVRRFESAPVPQHGAGFWNELEARLGAGPADSDQIDPDQNDAGGPLLATGVDLAPAHPATSTDRWGASRWLAVAATTIAVLGLGGALLVAQSRSSSPVQSAAAPSDRGSDDASETESPTPSASTSIDRSTTTAPSATTVPPPTVATGPDYFGDAVRIDPIGPGRVLAFSPDDGAVLVLDDAPGVAIGCEAAELLALFVQDLATGQRGPAIAAGRTIETGGLDLAISPSGAAPGVVGTRPVYGTEWCDGGRSSAWRGSMASDGQISMLESVEIGGDDDPFPADGEAPGTAQGLPSPDGEHVLLLSGAQAEVAEVGTEPGQTGPVVGSLTDDLGLQTITSAVWAPTGEAVALSADGSLVLWSPWTGASQTFESDSVTGLVFDNSGGRLAVASWDDGVTSSILTFGDRPEPVPAPPRCSGRTGFSPLTAEALDQLGLPKEVAATVLAIDRAASVCDWAELERLTPEEFVASFGGGVPVEVWRQEEGNGQSPMWYLRALFRQPHVVDDVNEPSFHVWPAIFHKAGCNYDEAEKESLAALGYDPDLVEDDCAVIGGYVGYRTAVDASGEWRFFVAGD